MKTFKAVVTTLVVLVILVPLAAVGFAWSGVYNVAATDEHWPITRWLLNTTVSRSVALRAEDIEVPDNLGERDRLLSGVNNYKEMCAGCHTPPGGEKSPVAKGLYPQPPELDHAAEEMNPAQLFWVVKHGIKATGMPAWGPTHDDDALWNIVALVEQFPGMSGQQYETLKTAAAGQGGHHGGGGDSGGHGHGGGDTAHEENEDVQAGDSGTDGHHGADRAHADGASSAADTDGQQGNHDDESESHSH
ncbi:cytochrome c family protein [Salinisphaera sp. PC39]|uniref:c-type cytochrome n=1 Tax=Salinisphaera sp. PC39 TaxID=1304156 RepID=UPI00333FC0CA